MKLEILTLGALLIQSTIANKAEVYSYCKKPGQVAITFDDGPKKDTTPIALDVLAKNNIKATFFINYNNWGSLDDNPEAIEVVKQAYKEGHDIGSHTYDHKDLFVALDDGTFEHNIDDMTTKIKEMIGVTPAYFRPPNGDGGYPDQEFIPDRVEKTKKVQEYLGGKGYSIIMWGADTFDWKHKENTAEVIKSLDSFFKAPNVSPSTHGFIVLLHDVHPTTVNVNLQATIDYIKNLNYEFVPLSECIGIPPYQEGYNQNNAAHQDSGMGGQTTNGGNITNSNNSSNVNNNNNNNAESSATTVHISLLLIVLSFVFSIIF